MKASVSPQFNVRSRRGLVWLALLAVAIVIAAAGLIAVLARTVPRFNQFILLVPILKPFRFYPPELPQETGHWRTLPAMPAPLRLAKRDVRSVEVSALANSSSVLEEEQLPMKDRANPPPARIVTREFTGGPAQDLTALWDAQHLDCASSGAMCFSPSYTLRFFNDDGAVLSVTLCWSCRKAQLVLEREHRWCEFDPMTPEATQLKQKLRALLPPVSTNVEWALPPETEGNATAPKPVSPVLIEPVTTSLPDAAALMQSEVQNHQGHLAYCYEQLLTSASAPEGQLVVEYDLAPYTPELHKMLVGRELLGRSKQNAQPEPGCWNSTWSTTGRRPLQGVTLVHSTIANQALTECVLDSLRHWRICRRPAPETTPLHARVTVTFRAPASNQR